MSVKAFGTGEMFLIDLYEAYEEFKQRLTEEMGGAAFTSVIEGLVEDALTYIFHGDQFTGERHIEAKLKRSFIDKVQAILITRLLFDKLYDCIGVKGQSELMGFFEYHLDHQRRLMLLQHTQRKRVRYTSIEDALGELEERMDNGDYVPERLRRAIHEYRA